jgi:hypothetical protein
LKYLKIGTTESVYNIIYHDKNNNLRITAQVPIKRKPAFFYLKTFDAQHNENRSRARKGLANYRLCGLLKTFITDKIRFSYLKLTPKSLLELDAGNLGGREEHSQEKLEKYYRSLGFKKGRQVDKPEEGQPFAQPIESFLKNCEKFKETP